MAISDPVAITQADSTANATTYDSAITGSLAVDDVVLITVFSVKGTDGGQPTLSKVGGTATIGAFTSIVSVGPLTDTDVYRIEAFWCKVTGAGTLQVRATFGTSQTGCHIIVQPLRGTDLTTPIRSVSGTPQTASANGTASRPSISLPAASATGSWQIVAASIRRNPGGYTASEAGWIRDFDSGLATPAHGYDYWHKESADSSFAADGGTNGTWRAIMFEVQEPVATDRSMDVSWAEMELPNAPRRADASWAEMELPNAPRRADVSWAESEVPTAPRRADISWSEMEAPAAPRRADVSWAEAETPDAPRRADVAWAEAEVPAAPRSMDVSWAEMEVPNSPATVAVEVSWAEMEVADAPRAADVGWAEMELPTAPRSADVSWAELEAPDLPYRADVSFAEMELPDAPRAAQVAWAELKLQPGSGKAGWEVSGGDLGIPAAGKNRRRKERPRGLGRNHQAR
jgi:hypothetical protein